MKYGFVEGKNGFNCVSCGNSPSVDEPAACHSPKREPARGRLGQGLGNPLLLDVAVTTERVRLDKRAAAGSGSSITPAASVTSRSGSPLLHLANPWARG